MLSLRNSLFTLILLNLFHSFSNFLLSNFLDRLLLINLLLHVLETLSLEIDDLLCLFSFCLLLVAVFFGVLEAI